MHFLTKSISSVLFFCMVVLNTWAESSMTEVAYTSNTVSGMRRMMVYLPDGYTNGTTDYPVFYLLHGGGQRYYTWANPVDGNAKEILDQAISSGNAEPMIVVMPDVPDFAPDLFTRELCNDVIPFVEKTYRVKTDKDSRALAGLSWGGLQVLDAGLYRYELFGYLGVFSSGWFIGDNVYNVMNQYLATDGADIEKSMQYLYFGQGGTGDIAYNNGQETMKVLRSHGITVNYWEHSGAHSFVCWRQDLQEILPFLFRYGLGSRTPFKSTPHNIPGKVEAEEYDNGGQGVAYFEANANGNQGGATFRDDEVDIEETTDEGGGYNIGYVLNGEWLEYSVEVIATGVYNLQLRVAAEGDGKLMHIEVDGEDVSGPVNIPNTGGWQTWETITVNEINLTEGEHVIRLAFDSDYMNLNYFQFNDVITSAISSINNDCKLYPNPFGDEGIRYISEGDFTYKISDLKNLVLEKGKGSGDLVLGENLKAGIYILSVEKGKDVRTYKIIKQ